VSLLLDLEARPIIVSMICAQEVRQRKQLGAMEVGMCWRRVREGSIGFDELAMRALCMARVD
jgi:hypothetical protein